jgi:hypothetical protein
VEVKKIEEKISENELDFSFDLPENKVEEKEVEIKKVEEIIIEEKVEVIKEEIKLEIPEENSTS